MIEERTFYVQVSWRTFSKGKQVRHIEVKAATPEIAKLVAIKKAVRTRDAFEVQAEVTVA